MDINNIAIVRATNVIPFDGVVRPISEVSYLCKESGTEFSFAMRDLLKKKDLLKKIDWSKPEEVSKTEEENIRILNQYVPYSSDYNSMVLWALNGLVPDDMNNTFSDKTCAIIDGLSEQMEQSEIVSLVPTDTAIKGNVNLSKQASVLISKERYEKLSQEEKDKLVESGLNITVFEGELREAVSEELIKSGRYTAETLSLGREDKGYIKSDTSDAVRETVKCIASERNIAQVLHLNVITGQNDELDKLENVKDEVENRNIVKNFYKKEFFEYLFSRMDIDDQVKTCALYFPDSPTYMEDLCSEINRIGIDKYKLLLDKYNKSLEKLRKEGTLPTPQEIINATRDNQKIDLISLIEGLDNHSEEYSDGNSILSSAIEETEKATRTGMINEQVADIKKLEREKDEKSKGTEIE